MKKIISTLFLIVFMLNMSGCSNDVFTNSLTKGASDITKQINENVYRTLNFSDKSEFDCIERGVIDFPESLEILNSDGKVVWSQENYNFVTNSTPSPSSVNPSLWSNAQMNHYYGLFEVTKGVYQVRGYDVTNLTIIEGTNGRIIVDPMSCVECAKEAMRLVNKNLGKKPVSAVILTNPDVNVYGGIKGVISEFDVKVRGVPIIASSDFVNQASTQNLFTSQISSNAAYNKNGADILADYQGKLSLGKSIGASQGTVSYIPPTDFINGEVEEKNLDGVNFIFKKSPKEMSNTQVSLILPDKKLVYLSELCSSTIQPFKDVVTGNVCDGNAWAKFLLQMTYDYQDSMETVCQAYNWPHFGKDEVKDYISNIAAAYKYINDRTLFLMNQGFTIDEIKENIEFPENLAQKWYLRGYNVTLEQNVDTTYEKYAESCESGLMNLSLFSKQEDAKRLIEYMGDESEIMNRAISDYKKGEYEWVAKITNALFTADNSNEQAKLLCADALEQLGYQSECGTLRNEYLSEAKRLRGESENKKINFNIQNKFAKNDMNSENILDYMGILIDSEKAQKADIKINLKITDTSENYFINLKNGVLTYYKKNYDDTTEEEVSLTKDVLNDIIVKKNIDDLNILGDKKLIYKLKEYICKY